MSAVAVPYKWCGRTGYDATIDSIVGNEFPPQKGDTLNLNVTGNLSKAVTDGTYNVSVVIDNLISLPLQTGNVSDFHPLPWPVDELNFTYSKTIPDGAPPGSYVVKIQAEDQDDTGIFCIQVSFTLKSRGGPLAALRDALQRRHAQQQQIDEQQSAELGQLLLPRLGHF